MKRILGLGLLILMSIYFVACTSAQDIEIELDAGLPVTVVEAQSGQVVDGFTTVGVIKPQAVYEVHPERGGIVEEILVASGDRVKRGDVLFILQENGEANNLQTTESNLRTLKVNLNNQLEDLKVQLEKTNALLNQGAASQSEVDNLNNQIRNLTNQLKDAEVAYRNQVSNLRDLVDDRMIKSPSDGFVANLNFEIGESVNNQNAITVIDDSSFIVVTQITSDQLRNIKEVSGIEVWLDGNESMSIAASIGQIDYTKDEAKGMYELILNLEKTEYEVYDGEYVELFFSEAQRTADLLPLVAVKRVGTENYLFYLEGEIARKVPVQLGQVVDEWVEIENLPTGKEWIVKGADRVQDGNKVLVTNRE